MPPTYRIGTSGWSYKHWKGDFYPSGLRQDRWLEYYAQHFQTVEINNSFYRLPHDLTAEAWGKRVPAGFTFTFKVSRFITHIKRLEDVAEAVDTFVDRARRVGPTHLGALLYQLPPDMSQDLPRLEAFLTLLPRDCAHVFEFRDPSWSDDATLEVLRRHGAGLCVHDMPGVQCPVAVTAPVAYFRFHGPAEQVYAGSYGHEQLEGWAEIIRSVGAGADTVYAYFNNDIGGHAVRNALALSEILTP